MEALIARAVQILIALGGAYILTLWFAIVVWTFQDIQARSRSVVAQIFSTLVVLIFSIPGLLVYMILRPRYTLDDAFQRSLEEEYLMQDLEELPLCPGCQQYVEDDWVFCPNCRTELRDNCIACDHLIDLRWEICPFCGTEQYDDEDDALPSPVVLPVMTPSPQYLGRPHLNQNDVLRLASVEERTRPIIPATVRVDLRSGDVLTENVPELPISPRLRPLSDMVEPRRVALDGNGARDLPPNDPYDSDTVNVADDAPDELSVSSDAADATAFGMTEHDATNERTDEEQPESAQVAVNDANRAEEPDSVPVEESEASAKPTRKRKPRRKKSRAASEDDSE